MKKENNIVSQEIKLGEFLYITDDEDTDRRLKMKISDVSWEGKITRIDGLDYEAANELLLITLESENIGKKVYRFSTNDELLVSSDGYEYIEMNSWEHEDKKSGINGSVFWDSNPGNKTKEILFFDAPKENLSSLKLIFTDSEKDLVYEFLLNEK